MYAFIKLVIVCMCAHACMHSLSGVHVTWCACRGQGSGVNLQEIIFSPSSIWSLGTHLQPSGLAASVLTLWAIPPFKAIPPFIKSTRCCYKRLPRLFRLPTINKYNRLHWAERAAERKWGFVDSPLTLPHPLTNRVPTLSCSTLGSLWAGWRHTSALFFPWHWNAPVWERLVFGSCLWRFGVPPESHTVSAAATHFSFASPA